jgi:hypothetical protein
MLASQETGWTVWLTGLIGGLAIYGLLLSAHGSGVLAGNLSNSDDMMRLSQVRDLLGGQGWFTVDQSRFITPEGGAMHWSRIPDIFIAGLILMATPFVGAANAEIFAALAWPCLVLVALVSGLLLLVRRFGGGLTGQLLALVTIATFAPIYQFWPGRIDHHGFNAALTVWAFAALSWQARPLAGSVIAGLLTVALLSVALEALPMAVGLIGAAGLYWLTGERDRETFAFGLSLGCAALIFAALDAPGWSDARAVCDAYGWAHVRAFLAVGAGFALLGVAGYRLDTLPGRLIGAGVIGGVVVALAALLARDCLTDPYAGVGDAAREAWLSLVSEARSLASKYAVKPAVAIFYFAPPLMALFALGWLVWQRRDIALGALALMLALALVVTVWQVRAMIFAQVLAVVPIALAGAMALRHWRSVRGPMPLIGFAAIMLALSPKSWWMISTSAFPARAEASVTSEPKEPGFASPGLALRTCQSRAAYAELAGLPGGTVFSPIDLGAAVITHTPHRALVAPYHRNVLAIGFAAETWATAPDEAVNALREAGADYVIICLGLAELDVHAGRGPKGLAARLLAGDVPEGLEPLQTGETLEIFAVTRR